jgi:hypothetical protein
MESRHGFVRVVCRGGDTAGAHLRQKTVEPVE